MVDFQRKNCDTRKLERIIANLKQHTQCNENLTNSCRTGNNLRDVPASFSKVCKESKSDSSNVQSNITDYFTVTKTAPVNRSSNDLTIWNVLHTLKKNKESSLVTTFEDKDFSEVPKSITDTNRYQTHIHSFNKKTDISLAKSSGCNTLSIGVINGKNKIDRQVNTSTEILRKTHNYYKRQDNKRLKIYNTTSQSAVTDFFKNDNKCSSNKTNSKISNIGEVDDKNLIEDAAFNNMNICCEQENYIKQINGNENVLSDKKQNQQNSGANVERKIVSHNKKEHNQTSFDDFCNDVVKIISQNSNKVKNIDNQNSREKLQRLHPTSNSLPKSHSTGTLIVKSQRGICKDLNSLPVTDLEIKSRREQLTNKISFDDFTNNILKEFRDCESYKNNDKGNMESSYCSKEINNTEYSSNKIEHLLGKLKNDSKEVPSTVTNSSSKPYLSTCTNKKSYQRNSESISQQLNSVDSANLVLNYNLENLELCSKTNYSKSCKDIVNKLDRNNLKETENGDVELNFLKNWNANKPFSKEPPVELSATNSFTGTECFPLSLSVYEVLPEVPQDDSNVVQINNSLNEREIGYKGDRCYTHCTYEYPNFTDSSTPYIESNNQRDENSIGGGEPINSVLKDNLLKNSLINVESDHVKSETEQSRTYRNIKLDGFLEKLLKQDTLRHDTNCGKNKFVSNKTCIKRYRKGKTKICRLKKLKKVCPKTDIVEEHKENVNFEDVLKKITQDVCTQNSHMSRSKSMSSVSTTSSYVTDLSRSEILSTGSNELSSSKQRLRKGFNELCKDKSLLYCKEQWENTEHEKEEIKMKIQEIIKKVVEDFTEKKESSLKYRKQSFSNCIFKDGRLQLKPMPESSMTVINSKAQRSQSKFTLIFYLLKKIQNLLETDTKLTKRELYYQLKTFIKDQHVTDRAINAISCLLNVGMWTLNIVAQKGLVFGDLKILLSSGETLNCNIPGTLIPQDINDIVEIASPAYFILVVEKESIFLKLIEEDLPNRLTRPFIMITGKGFPDLNTQLFLKKLWMIMSIPVFILVDADPHGINIMLNYRFGSVNNAHVSHQLAIPNAKWLGVYPSEVINLNITRELLSERELKMVNQLLKTPYMDSNPKIVNELKVLLETKCKAEIEGLIKTDTYLSEVYLPNKFFTHNFI